MILSPDAHATGLAPFSLLMKVDILLSGGCFVAGGPVPPKLCWGSAMGTVLVNRLGHTC